MALRITHSTSIIVHIVDEILDISGKESIHYLDKTDLVHCNGLAREMLAPYMDHQENVDIKFEPLLKENCCILVNRHEVEKILHHLLDNAVKFTQQGSITLRTYQSKPDNIVCFSVTDTGCGVKEGDEEKIFEHFYKSDVYKEGGWRRDTRHTLQRRLPLYFETAEGIAPHIILSRSVWKYFVPARLMTFTR